ncbi:MAG: VOC family protein [Oscillospiraceae bacterium]|nr:VOC family protein [Oscillospiraceae bacterium]
MIKGIHHVSMRADSDDAYERAKQFYLGVLGLTVKREWPEGIMLDTGAGLIEIFRSGGGARICGAVRHFALAADDVDTLADRIAAAGYEVFVAPKDITIASDPPCPARIAFCRGPLGEEIELFCER